MLTKEHLTVSYEQKWNILKLDFMNIHHSSINLMDLYIKTYFFFFFFTWVQSRTHKIVTFWLGYQSNKFRLFIQTFIYLFTFYNIQTNLCQYVCIPQPIIIADRFLPVTFTFYTFSYCSNLKNIIILYKFINSNEWRLCDGFCWIFFFFHLHEKQ